MYLLFYFKAITIPLFSPDKVTHFNNNLLLLKLHLKF